MSQTDEDAETKVTVEVTTHDIRHGKVSDAGLCPVARAINRLLRPLYKASAGRYMLGIRIQDVYKSESQIYVEFAVLPKSATDFIDSFDNGEPVKPFSFELSLPKRVLRA